MVAAVRGASGDLAMRGLAEDFDLRCELHMYLDSSAAIGLSRRTGVGRIRDLDTRLLWLQEVVAIEIWKFVTSNGMIMLPIY